MPSSWMFLKRIIWRFASLTEATNPTVSSRSPLLSDRLSSFIRIYENTELDSVRDSRSTGVPWGGIFLYPREISWRRRYSGVVIVWRCSLSCCIPGSSSHSANLRSSENWCWELSVIRITRFSSIHWASCCCSSPPFDTGILGNC